MGGPNGFPNVPFQPPLMGGAAGLAGAPPLPLSHHVPMLGGNASLHAQPPGVPLLGGAAGLGAVPPPLPGAPPLPTLHPASHVEAHLAGAVEKVARESGGGSVASASDRLVLRPSNGVLEASDYLTNKHDWVQMAEEVTGSLRRAVFTPSVNTNREEL